MSEDSRSRRLHRGASDSRKATVDAAGELSRLRAEKLARETLRQAAKLQLPTTASELEDDIEEPLPAIDIIQHSRPPPPSSLTSQQVQQPSHSAHSHSLSTARTSTTGYPAPNSSSQSSRNVSVGKQSTASSAFPTTAVAVARMVPEILPRDHPVHILPRVPLIPHLPSQPITSRSELEDSDSSGEGDARGAVGGAEMRPALQQPPIKPLRRLRKVGDPPATQPAAAPLVSASAPQQFDISDSDSDRSSGPPGPSNRGASTAAQPLRRLRKVGDSSSAAEHSHVAASSKAGDLSSAMARLHVGARSPNEASEEPPAPKEGPVQLAGTPAGFRLPSKIASMLYSYQVSSIQ